LGRAWESVGRGVCVEIEVNVEVKFGLGRCACGSATGPIGRKPQVAEAKP